MCKYMYHDIKLQEPLVCKCITNNFLLKTQNVAYKWNVLLVCNSAVMVILFYLNVFVKVSFNHKARISIYKKINLLLK